MVRLISDHVHLPQIEHLVAINRTTSRTTIVVVLVVAKLDVLGRSSLTRGLCDVIAVRGGAVHAVRKDGAIAALHSVSSIWAAQIWVHAPLVVPDVLVDACTLR